MSAFTEISRSVRDAVDILGRARSPLELAKALVPASLLERRILNLGEPPAPGPRPADEIAATLRLLTRRLESEVLGAGGRGVGYAQLASSPTFALLEETSRLLLALHLPDLPRGAPAQAFWINLYNVLVIHGVVALRIRKSVMEVPSFFGSVAYRIGDLLFTPDEIENGVLRANSPHPATRARPFNAGDPRLALAVPRVDPRVHTALVCAAKACPPIGFYDGERLEEQLDLAARSFVENDTEIVDTKREVQVSLIYKYYVRDFGGEDGVRRFLVEHLEGARREALARAFDAGFGLVHRRYDWDLNAIG